MLSERVRYADETTEKSVDVGLTPRFYSYACACIATLSFFPPVRCHALGQKVLSGYLVLRIAEALIIENRINRFFIVA